VTQQPALRVIVEADGGSRGNPGPAGYGALVRDADTGELLREIAAGIGVASNNVAEYRGLIAGLQAALDLGAAVVEVRMDSKLVVEQMSARWKVKHPDMKVLAREAAELVRQFDEVRFQHMRREFNSHADRLANEAMDASAAGRSWVAPRGDPAGTAAAPPVLSVAVEPPAAEPGPPAAPAVRNILYGWGAPAGTPTVAWLLRHGETPLSLERRFSGQDDAALTDRGRAQAGAAARRLAELSVDAVISSPVRRARQTAEAVAVAMGLDVVIEPGFAESDFGDWQGFSFAEVHEQWPAQLQRWLEDPGASPPGGESQAATDCRVRQARERMLSSYAGATVVVVSHVTPIKLLVRAALDAPAHAPFRMQMSPGSLSVIDWFDQGHDVLRLFNDTSHLGGHVTPKTRL
jgi:broad specificity phosphatase PhoE/ribonuclease HI